MHKGNRTHFIYALTTGGEKNIFYIGRTQNRLSARLSAHRYSARNGKTKTAKHISQILDSGGQIYVIKLETLELASSILAIKKEKTWIRRYQKTHTLTNIQRPKKQKLHKWKTWY